MKMMIKRLLWSVPLVAAVWLAAQDIKLTLSGGASVRQDWCSDFGSNGCTAVNITGGTVAMCP